MKRLISTLILPLILFTTAFGQNSVAKTKLLQNTNVQALQRIANEASIRFNAEKTIAIKKAKDEGWPIRQELEDGKIVELIRLDAFGDPVYYTTNNVIAAQSVSTDKVWPGGSAGLSLTGSGMTAGEWDGGAVRTSHQEFGGRVNQADGATSISNHATHVAGTIMASGVESNAKGMAYQADLDAYDWNNDASEMATAASNGLLVSNHSYGFIRGWRYNSDDSVWGWYGNTTISTTEDYLFGFYDYEAGQWDEIAYNAPYYLIMKSAGNDRNDSFSGTHHHGGDTTSYTDSHGDDGAYDCISQNGVAKNVLTVGAVNDIPGGYSGPGSVVQTSFSSWGPADDGRIKPDIVANGSGLYSSLGGSDTDYASYSGTSMSSPSTTGSLLLLQEHYNDENLGTYMLASTLKGLALHTADEAGANDGPDYQNGWGLLNTQTAAQVITGNGASTIIDERMLNNGDSYSFPVEAAGTQPLRVTVCWTDPAGTPVSASLDPTDKMLVNDLDIRVIKDATTYYPWRLDVSNPSNAATKADNDVDNVENLIIDSPVSGTYTVNISHKGTISSGQNYSIIVSGIVQQPPTALINSSYFTGCTGSSLTFQDVSIGATSLVWSFPGGTPSTSTDINPVVSYTAPGSYDVQLIATNTFGSDTVIHSGLVQIGTENSMLTINTDNYGSETTWELRSVLGNVISSGGPYNSDTTYTTGFCLADSCYELVVFDSYGDGICCSFGSGSYHLVNTATGDTLAQGADFLFADTTAFCLSSLTCDVPASYTTTNILQDQATLNWATVASALDYQLRFRAVGAGSWSFSTVVAPVTFKIKTGLTSATDYEWQIKSQCNGDTSSYGPLQSFTTTAPYCINPDTLLTTNVLHNKVTFNWNAIGNAIKYKIRYRTMGSGTWSAANTLAPATTRTRGGLTPETDYEWQIKVECDAQSPSSYGPLQSFTTTAEYCANPVTFNVSDLGAVTAQMNWNSVLNAIQYKVRIKEVGAPSWTNHTVTDTLKFKGNLSPETDYEWRVKAVCDQLSPGGYGSTQFFNTPGISCAHPEGYFEDNISETQATLHWNVNAYANQYKLRFRAVGAGSWDQHYITPPIVQYTKTGLTLGTQYEWKVKTSCTADSPSGYGPGQNFTTNAPPSVRLANSNGQGLGINVFPNPTLGMVTVQLGSSVSSLISIRNMQGQIIHRESLVDTKQLDLEISGAAGLYTIEVITSNGTTEVFRVVKE